ncbi:MAG: hypothetical protein HETSPECPRED_006346 [Heterodermia speciosa]|uniref:Uncharacterized protein n=1 Tax=Heterodermia speciosa TaxID=116794 RepID=A0A8H3FJY6_9LECA|nr:MAG: hypothetical protein HETSPECPRED_006346 [Heterodermia speciosa]
MLQSVLFLQRELKQALVYCVLITCCYQSINATTVAANTPGLYYEYYNSGISPTPITAMPNWAALTVASSNFAAGTTGNFGNPQRSSSDIYCGGYYHGYLYVTTDGSHLPYIIGAQAKDGFSVTVGTTTFGQNNIGA